MRIEKIDIYKSPIKLKEPFVISLGAFDYAENLVVVINTDTGLKGFGECSPFMTINGESMDTCFVVAQYLAKVLVGKDPLDIEVCSQIMDKVIFGNSSIKSAVDIALYDISAQNAGMPLYAFLGGKNNKTLITDYTVSIGDPEKMAIDAQKIKDNGFKVIKVKLGSAKEIDVTRIQIIRKAIGNDIPLRIDANQGWDTQTAIDVLTTLAPYNIQFCEEPIARWNFMALPEVRKQSPIPILADECCCDHNDAQRLINIAASDGFNIKLGKSSGIFKARKIVKLGEDAALKMQIGGFLESRLAFTASAHLALTSDAVHYCDFDTPLMFVEDPVVNGISYGDNGVVTVPELPGLGAAIDENYLQRLMKVTVVA